MNIKPHSLAMLMGAGAVAAVIAVPGAAVASVTLLDDYGRISTTTRSPAHSSIDATPTPVAPPQVWHFQHLGPVRLG